MLEDKIEKLKKVMKNPKIIIIYLGSRGFFKKIPDKRYVELLYEVRFNKPLNLQSPQDFNEKIQWLKLYNRDPQYTCLTDKYEVRKYVKEKIGEEYLIPIFGVWDSFESIDFKKLPEKFVLKCTHDSGSVVVIDKNKEINMRKTSRFFRKKLKFNFFWRSREWNYYNIKPRIIAEEYLEDEKNSSLTDYKIFTFNGKPKLIQVDVDRFGNHRRNIYTTNWELLDVQIKIPNDPQLAIPRPKQLKKMLEIAEVLSEGIPHVRVDLYISNGSIYFGELTFHHGGGQEKIYPDHFNKEMGKWIVLPKEKNKNGE